MTLDNSFTAVVVIAARYLMKTEPNLDAEGALVCVLKDSRLELHPRQCSMLVRLIEMDRSRQ